MARAKKGAKRRSKRRVSKEILTISIHHAGARLGHAGGIATARERKAGTLGSAHRGRKGAKKRTAKKGAKKRTAKRKTYRITKGPHKGMRMTIGKNGSRHYYWP
jgi:hypothetical protein